ncbi:MAG: MFS transporter [Actinomycetota bacterium]|nr:MFS transporter [Actinomycetota bacterium]
MTAALRRSFDSLQVPNYRRYFVGQIVSLSGNWMQTVAEIWLVLTLTDSGVAVGLTTALQFLPILLFGAWGGLLADRFAKRRLLIVTQALMALPALALFALSSAGVVTVAMVYALVFARGAVNAVDNPTRQSFVIEIVGTGRVVNAVSLNSVLVHSARIIGPALAGVLIATVGVEPCFAINAATFGAMIFALRRMEPGELRPAPQVPRERGAVRSALRHVAATPRLAVPLALMAIVGTLGYNFQTVLPLLARFSFGGGATVYAALVSAMAIGSVAGALATGARGRTSASVIAGAALGFGVLSLLAAGAPTLALELPVLALLGAATVTFAASVNSYLQLEVRPDMRGRVMALYSIVFLGSTPIGGPIAGWLSEAFDPRVALVLAGVSGLSAAWAARTALARVEREHPPRAQSLRDATEEPLTEEQEVLAA